MEAIRSKIVATKEGSAITGEKRLREFLGGLYSDVNGYEGRPIDQQVARAVIKEFTTLTGRGLPGINRELQSKEEQPIAVLCEDHWKASETGDSPGGSRRG